MGEELPQQRFLDAKELASWLNMDVRTLRKYVRAGVFPAGVLVGKTRKWSRVDAGWCMYAVINRDRFKVTPAGESEDEDDDE